MKPLWRIVIAFALASTGSLALAQSQPPTTPSSSTPSGDLIGPPQLSNFSLGGKVTQPAASQPTEIQPLPKARPTAPEQRAPALASAPPRMPKAAEEAQPSRQGNDQPAAESRSRPKRTSDELQGFTNPTPPPAQSAPPSPATAAIAQPTPATGSTGPSVFLWLLAAAVAAGAAAWYFLWQKPRSRLAPAGIGSAFIAPEAAPAPRAPPAAPPPAVAPPKPKSTGVVATRLRPWVDFQFTPGRVILDGEKAVLEFEMTLFNSGSAPARDVLVEGALFNASPLQDEQIAGFFQRPVGEGNRLPLLAPLQRLPIKSAIILSRAQLVPLELEGRSLFVPIAGFNALYRWGSSSHGQTSASYLVGKQTNGEKLGPFGLDLGPRVFRRLAAREYELRVRQ